MRDVFAIDGAIRDYPWGSREAIPALLGRVPDGRPVAELWFGAHPDDASFVPDAGRGLDALIAADPAALLGADTVRRFGPQLPFMVKLLAAERALSIQVHPNREQARAGFAAENAQGLAGDDPRRNYRDANHKPELLCALTPFRALCGFRPPAQAAALIDALPPAACQALAPVSAALRDADQAQALRAAFGWLLTRPEPARGALVEEVVAACRTALEPADTPQRWADGVSGAIRALDLCATDFPGDIGALVSLLLNPVVLAPGEAIFLAAGNVHCYLRGFGVEVMAASDNVLRAGLTGKHIDVPELLAITDFTPLPDPRWPARVDGPVSTFAVGVPDFQLTRVELSAPALSGPGHRPTIVLGTAGKAEVSAPGAAIALGAGQAAVIAGTVGAWELRGDGEVFIATTRAD